MKYYYATAKRDLICLDGDHAFIVGKTYLVTDSYAEGEKMKTIDEQGYVHTLGEWERDFELEEIDEATYNLLIHL